MKIIFSNHSPEKLEERKISKKEVKKILNNSNEIRKAKYGRNIAQKIKNNKLYRVVYIEKPRNRYVVITAYRTDPQRYGVEI